MEQILLTRRKIKKKTWRSLQRPEQFKWDVAVVMVVVGPLIRLSTVQLSRRKNGVRVVLKQDEPRDIAICAAVLTCRWWGSVLLNKLRCPALLVHGLYHHRCHIFILSRLTSRLFSLCAMEIERKKLLRKLLWCQAVEHWNYEIIDEADDTIVKHLHGGTPCWCRFYTSTCSLQHLSTI